MQAPFATRVAELDRLELALLSNPDPATLARVTALEAANARVVDRLHARLCAGRYTRAGLHRALARLASPADVDGYDALDQLVGDLLDAGDLPPEEVEREPEMVFYQPTPARVILELATHLRPDDVVYDLGAGLGHVVILVALLAGVDARGIELEPTYVAHAERTARALGLANARFTCADAREAPFADATAIFMYTPFRGAMLAQVLDRLPRGVRLFTHGPCSAEVPDLAPWLATKALV